MNVGRRVDWGDLFYDLAEAFQKPREIEMKDFSATSSSDAGSAVGEAFLGGLSSDRSGQTRVPAQGSDKKQ